MSGAQLAVAADDEPGMSPPPVRRNQATFTNVTPNGIVLGGAPLAALMARGPAERALSGLRMGTTSADDAADALAELEDAVRQLSQRDAAPYASLVADLRAAITEARRNAAPQRIRRRPPSSWLARTSTEAVARHRAGEPIERVVAALTDSPGALRQLGTLSRDRLERDLRVRGMPEAVAERVIEGVIARLGPAFHDAVRTQARDELRREEHRLDRGARRIEPEFGRLERTLWGPGGGELIERIRLAAPEQAEALERLVDRSQTHPRERAALRQQARGALSLGLHALRDRVADYRGRVERSEEGYDAHFGDAYRAFPRVARSLARSLGFALEGPPRRGESLAAEAVRQHLRDATEAHEDARDSGVRAMSLPLIALRVPSSTALLRLADQFLTLKRNEERAMAGLGDVGALPEERARLAQSVARVLGEAAIRSILRGPAIQQLKQHLLDPGGPFMDALREHLPEQAERAGPIIAEFLTWLANQAGSAATREAIDAAEQAAGAPPSDYRDPDEDREDR